MHFEILNPDQQKLLSLLSNFNKEFYLVGGTAISLHKGHRLSIDFDMFKNGAINPKKILSTFDKADEKYTVTLNRQGQLNLICRNVKFTFFDFNYDIPHKEVLQKFISFPSLLDLAAMKAFALGMRSKWKDYLDLYFIIKDNYSIKEISDRSATLFTNLFSEKLFRSQLSYFEGISFEEQVEFMPGFEVEIEEVKSFLVEAALEGF